MRFGRDVYLSKDEAMLLAAEPPVGSDKIAESAGTEQSKVPPVQEGDVLLFQVKLSTEGFPQAVQVRKIRRLQGVVQLAPSEEAEGIIVVTGKGDAGDVDDGTRQLLGAEVCLKQAECGQLQIAPNDKVAFCCVSTTQKNGQILEAQLVELLSTSRVAGSLLGCFSLHLPKLCQPIEHANGHLTGASDNDVSGVELYGHALADRIVLSDVPADVSGPDLMCLFGKLGGKEPVMTPRTNSRELGMASIAFSGPEQVAKFLSQATHTVSRDGLTKLARVGPCLKERSSTNSRTCVAEFPPNPMEHDAVLGTTLADQKEVHQKLPFGNGHSSSYDNYQSMQTSMQASCSPLKADAHTAATMPSIPSGTAMPGWRCIHNNIVLSPAAPEMLAASDNFCSVCIQWPTVVHASSYVVELLDQGTMMAQRFLRPMQEGALPALVDLRVDGLQPTAYSSCVRCIAPCGCESAPSAWSFFPLGSLPAPNMASAPQMLAPTAPSSPPMCPPPPCAPPSFSFTTTAPTTLPPIFEETMDTGNCCEEPLTLD